MNSICSALLIVMAASCSFTAVAADAVVQRQEVGNQVTESVPAIPSGLSERMGRYQNTRGATFSGWTQDGCMLVDTRFAETVQAHRVCQPLGMREQLTFYPEPIHDPAPAPIKSARKGFVFGKDIGGNEFSQLYWYDLATRETTLLTDGKKSQSNGVIFSHHGDQLAYSSTARNGTDTDVWLMDTATLKSRPLVTEGGNWSASDFSPDGKRLLVTKYTSANESHPGEVDLSSGKLQMIPVDGGKAAFGALKYAADGAGLYFVSDEPVGDKPAEFRSLRYRANGSGHVDVLTGDIPWDIDDFEVSEDGKHLAYVSNEDGVYKLTVLALPSRQPVKLPALPQGVVSGLAFSPDGDKLALTLVTATSPSDAYVVDLTHARIVRWTRSEVGGLDVSHFVAPTLVQFPTFDQVGDKPRAISAFYYRAPVRANKAKSPVVIDIHGGPEGQAVPYFDPSTQFLVNELGVAVLMPNVRGSAGYGKTFLTLDNAQKREDSVKDIGALLDWIARQPELDASRIGVTGGSYGGYMVLASLMHYGDRIRAGIDVVGISDFSTFLNNTESYRRDRRRAEYGDERKPEMKRVFDRISPLKHASLIRSPLFVAQGRNDPRVPYTEAEQIVGAVRGNGQPVWFMMFNDEGHGFRKKANINAFNAATMLFWQRYLLDEQQLE